MKWVSWMKERVSEYDWWSFGTVLVASAIGGFIGLTIALHGSR